MIVDFEPLVVLLQRSEFTEEGEVFSRILNDMTTILLMAVWLEQCKRRIHLLCMLGNHQHELEIVHSQCYIEQRIRIYQEYDILHRFFNEGRIPT